MAVIPDSDLQSALNARLNTLTGGLAIAWENTPLKPVVGTPYLRAWLLPAEPAIASLGPSPWQERRGIFQVDCCYPVGDGWGTAKTKVAALVTHFCAGTRLTYNTLVVVVEKSWPGPALVDEGWYRISVSILYSCYSNAQ